MGMGVMYPVCTHDSVLLYRIIRYPKSKQFVAIPPLSHSEVGQCSLSRQVIYMQINAQAYLSAEKKLLQRAGYHCKYGMCGENINKNRGIHV